VSDRLSLTVDGVDEFIAACRAMDVELRQETAQLVASEAPGVEARTKAATPIAADAHHGHPPGALRRGVRVRVDDLTMEVRSAAPHAHLVEFGSVRWAGHPTFFQATNAERRAFRARVLGIVRRPRPQVGDGTPTIDDTGDDD
jgi:hypothetical protein